MFYSCKNQTTRTSVFFFINAAFHYINVVSSFFLQNFVNVYDLRKAEKGVVRCVNFTLLVKDEKSRLVSVAKVCKDVGSVVSSYELLYVSS